MSCGGSEALFADSLLIICPLQERHVHRVRKGRQSGVWLGRSHGQGVGAAEHAVSVGHDPDRLVSEPTGDFVDRHHRHSTRQPAHSPVRPERTASGEVAAVNEVGAPADGLRAGVVRRPVLEPVFVRLRPSRPRLERVPAEGESLRGAQILSWASMIFPSIRLLCLLLY